MAKKHAPRSQGGPAAPAKAPVFGPPALSAQATRGNAAIQAELSGFSGEAEEWALLGEDKASETGKAKSKEPARPASMPHIGEVAPTAEILAAGRHQDLDGGAYSDSWMGTSFEQEVGPSGSVGSDGVAVGGASGKFVASTGQRIGVGGDAHTEGKYGTADAHGEVEVVNEAGLEGEYHAGSDGFGGSARVAHKSGVQESAGFSLTSAEVAGGDAGLSGEVVHFTGIRDTAGIQGGISKDLTGVKVDLGIMAGTEVSGSLDANVGPVGGKAQGSAVAGVAAQLNGEIAYKNGKLILSAKAAAALGVGLSGGLSVELDIDEAIEMGGEVAKLAYRFADQDGDDSLTMNDAATGAGNVMNGGTEAIDEGADTAISALDADGDDHFSENDLALHAEHAAKQAAGNVTDVAKDIGGRAGRGAKDVEDRAGQAIGSAKGALDLDGDGDLTRGDVGAGARKAAEGAAAFEGKVIEAAGASERWVEEHGTKALEDAEAVKNAAVGIAANGAKAAFNEVDASGDGNLGVDDMRVHGERMGNAAAGAGQAVGNAAVSGVNQVNQDLHATGNAVVGAGQAVCNAAVGAGNAVGAVAADGVKQVDRDLHFVADSAVAARNSAVGAGQAAHSAAANLDGKEGLELGDAKVVIDAAERAVRQKADDVKKAVWNVVNTNGDDKLDGADGAVVRQRATAEFNAGLDRAREGADRAIAKMKEVPTVIATVQGQVNDKAASVVAEASRQANQAKSTFSSSAGSAAKRLAGTWSKISRFFGG